MRGTYKNPTEDASPPWRDGFASLTGWRPSPYGGGPITTPRPARGGGRHPHGSDSTSEPTPPKGGSDDPLYI